jgi:succinate-acetate transporter protein
MILAMGLCYGGTAQVIAGIMEWKKGNTFATTAFISYGFFWISFVTLVVLPKIVPAVVPASETALAAYLAIWGLFTAVMFLGTFRLSRALQVVFGTLTILFFLLAFGDYTAASASFKHATGDEGIVCGLAAIYTGLAQVLNELSGKIVLPLGAVKK